jgi:circadian clock protein KaiC
MASVGIDLQPWMDKGLLSVRSSRPSLYGLEEHLVTVFEAVARMRPACVVMDPITDFLGLGAAREVKSMLVRVIDHLKARGTTFLLTALTPSGRRSDESVANVSSLVDTWVALDLADVGHAHRRELHVVKSRGMAHSQDVRELTMSARGLGLRAIAPEGKS